MKTLDRLAVLRLGDEIQVEASARAFLHNQVRSMVGSLKHVGEGRWSAADLAAALAARPQRVRGGGARRGPLSRARGAWPAGARRKAADPGDEET